jgi:hypothetical protein
MKTQIKNWEQFATQTKEAIRLQKMEDARKRSKPTLSTYTLSQLQPTFAQCVTEKNISGFNPKATLESARGVGKKYHRMSPPATIKYRASETIGVSVKQNTCVVDKPKYTNDTTPKKTTWFYTKLPNSKIELVQR